MTKKEYEIQLKKKLLKQKSPSFASIKKCAMITIAQECCLGGFYEQSTRFKGNNERVKEIY